ncbi:MAG: DUF882 domain-containing protein [Alphaproteobacteria bacterium]|nr:DUF882 domain-containing protein [Alphaproteobacteria bacterium]
MDSKAKTQHTLSRRQLLTGMAAVAAFAALPKMAHASLSGPPRMLAFENLHTGERLKITYWANGSYIPGALAEINHILRDYRNNAVKPIDLRLMDTLVLLQRRMESTAPFQVISGYRSPATNAMLHARSEGVATHSLHLEGKAIDIRLPGHALSDLHRAALALSAGGVGYYPKSDFVHVDTGRIRRWGA